MHPFTLVGYMWHIDINWQGMGSGQGWSCSGDEMVAGVDDGEKKACSYQLPLRKRG